MMCPKCLDPETKLDISAHCDVVVTVNRAGGVLNTSGGDVTWDEDDVSVCTVCNWEGTVGEAQKAEPERKAWWPERK